MKIIHHNNHLLVEVPEGAYDFQLSAGFESSLWYSLGETKSYISFQAADCTLIGLASEMSEEQVRGIVDSHQFKVRLLYLDYATAAVYRFASASKAFASLLAKHGMKATETVVIKIN